jgi:hypothetical protein
LARPFGFVSRNKMSHTFAAVPDSVCRLSSTNALSVYQRLAGCLEARAVRIRVAGISNGGTVSSP